MTAEIDAVHERCRVCGQATAFVVRHREADEDGDLRVVVRIEDIPHTRADCDQMQRLERESWPTLW